MPLLEDLLLRFRRVWAPPGPVTGQAGVPADLDARLENELQQLTVQLAAVEAECDAIVRDAEREAEAILSGARQKADRALAEARASIPTVRSNSAVSRASRREAEIEKLLDDAAARAAEVRRRAETRMRPVVAEAVRSVFADLAEQAKENGAGAVGRS